MLVSVLVCDSVRRGEEQKTTVSAVTVGMSLASRAVSSRTQRAWGSGALCCQVKSIHKQQTTIRKPILT